MLQSSDAIRPASHPATWHGARRVGTGLSHSKRCIWRKCLEVRAGGGESMEILGDWRVLAVDSSDVPWEFALARARTWDRSKWIIALRPGTERSAARSQTLTSAQISLRKAGETL